ncbi:hypothetical protein GQ53DRAFT_208649 [Thozetella sp. PMI_491]|nr:hypothetical protein GQ53DRAFT_208649 [Thozetella sp. PMI_491]
MPPKRGSRSARGAVAATPSRGTRRTQALVGSSDSGSARRALPVKHSTAYGSAMPDLPSPLIMRTGSLGAALKEIGDEKKAEIEARRAAKAKKAPAKPLDGSDDELSRNNDALGADIALGGATAPLRTPEKGVEAAGKKVPAPAAASKKGGDAPAPAASKKRTERDPASDKDAEDEQAARDAQVQKGQQENAEKVRQEKEAPSLYKAQPVNRPARQQEDPDEEWETRSEAAARRMQEFEDGWPHRALAAGLADQDEFRNAMAEVRAERAARPAGDPKDTPAPGARAQGDVPTRGTVRRARRDETEEEASGSDTQGTVRAVRQQNTFERGPDDPPPTGRSFIEENAIFGRAKVDSPLAGRFAQAAGVGMSSKSGGSRVGRGLPSRLRSQLETVIDLPPEDPPLAEESPLVRDQGNRLPEQLILQPPLHLEPSDATARSAKSLRNEHPVLAKQPTRQPQEQSHQTRTDNMDHQIRGGLPAPLKSKWRAAVIFVLQSVTFWTVGLAVLLALVRSATTSAPARWYGWDNWRLNVGQFVPGSLSPALGNLTTDQSQHIINSLWTQEKQLEGLQHDFEDTVKTVDKLGSLLPDFIHVKKNTKTGKVEIDSTFWHAVKDLAQKDKDIFSLDPKTRDIRDDQWDVLRPRMTKDALVALADSKELVEKVEGAFQKTLPNALESWIEVNHKKVNAILSKLAPQSGELPLKVEQQLLSKTEKLVNDKLSAADLSDKVVTKEEFLASLTERFASQQEELERRFTELKDGLAELVEKARIIETTPPAGGLSTREVQTLVNGMIEKAISNIRLEAAAKSQIATHFDQALRHEVNYFAAGNGALVNPQLSSPSYAPTIRPTFSDVWKKVWRKLPRFQLERGAALGPWTEAGECWCADSASRPAEIAVQLADTIIPQHIVIEHIDPAATIDPGATPQDIEVWVAVDKDRLDKAQSFQAAHFPNTRPNDPLAAKNFVKIGEFAYKYSRQDVGIQVHQFTKELVEMQAATDHVIVRARTNQGADDHTCFYRIRLYGKPYEYETKS